MADTENGLIEYWGDKEEIVQVGNRLKAMLPGELSDADALAFAQYCALTDSNPLRGDIYAWSFKGKLVTSEGYKLLVRWAKQECGYVEEFVEMTTEEKSEDGLGSKDAAVICYILRDDKADLFRTILAACMTDGMSYHEAKSEAYQVAATSATGSAKSQEFAGKKELPSTWTLTDVAKKRALKKALRFSHGSPSPKQISAQTWNVQGTQTQVDDWEGVEIYNTTAERERHAQLSAEQRERNETVEQMPDDKRAERTTIIKEATELMAENGDDDPLGAQAKLSSGMKASAAFWEYANSHGVDRDVAGAFLQETNGDFGKALKLMEDLKLRKVANQNG